MKIPVIKPEMREGTRVYIDNKQHRFHRMNGIVVARDHRHYRVKLENKTILWCPEHWIEPLKNKPKE